MCTEKEEHEGATTETDGDESVDTFGQERDGAAGGSVVRSPLFGQFHFSVNSCAEKPNKHVCTKM